jgi:hypothetical protein
MDTDKTQPRIGRIVFVGVVLVVALLSVREGLVSYFDTTSRAEELRKALASAPTARLAIQAAESHGLASGDLPIERAMKVLSGRGRLSTSLEIQPGFSRDVSPLMGWMQMPANVPVRMTIDQDASADGAPDSDAQSKLDASSLDAHAVAPAVLDRGRNNSRKGAVP